MNNRTRLCLCAVAVSLSACGGGGGETRQILTPGTYKLTFSAISTARLEAPVSGIDVAVRFPAGLSVSTPTGGGTGQITSSSITPGSSISTTSLAFGVYSASTRTAYLTMATTQENYRGGQFLNLIFSVAPGASVTATDIYDLNKTFPYYKVVGLDSATHSSVSMSGMVKTTLGVGK